MEAGPGNGVAVCGHTVMCRRSQSAYADPGDGVAVSADTVMCRRSQ